MRGREQAVCTVVVAGSLQGSTVVCERQGAGSVYCGGSWLSTGVYSSM